MLVSVSLVFQLTIFGQSQPDDAGIVIALRIAERLKDSVGLTDGEKIAVYEANLWLHNQKIIAWSQFNSTSNLTTEIQRIENKRDSLYRNIIAESRFQLYFSRKKNLIHNN